MNKKFSLFLIILTIGILYIFNIERVIQHKLSVLNQSIQSNYLNIFVSVNNAIDKYIYQLEYIDELKKTNNSHLKYKLLYDSKLSELNELNKNVDIIKSTKLEFKLNKVKVLSYYKFNDHSRVIIDKKDLNTTKIYSLITFDGYSAGIVLNKNNISIAYLNENERCNYTVFVGKENAPGITSGIYNNGNILIKYVPIWKNVSIGDEVITSSMDSIFPYGIKVGKVTDITIKDNIQEVLVLPYAKTLGNRDYYLYSHSKQTKTNN
jgi:rod shape-determining protein MreC